MTPFQPGKMVKRTAAIFVCLGGIGLFTSSATKGNVLPNYRERLHSTQMAHFIVNIENTVFTVFNVYRPFSRYSRASFFKGTGELHST